MSISVPPSSPPAFDSTFVMSDLLALLATFSDSRKFSASQRELLVETLSDLHDVCVSTPTVHLESTLGPFVEGRLLSLSLPSPPHFVIAFSFDDLRSISLWLREHYIRYAVKFRILCVTERRLEFVDRLSHGAPVMRPLGEAKEIEISTSHHQLHKGPEAQKLSFDNLEHKEPLSDTVPPDTSILPVATADVTSLPLPGAAAPFADILQGLEEEFRRALEAQQAFFDKKLQEVLDRE